MPTSCVVCVKILSRAAITASGRPVSASGAEAWRTSKRPAVWIWLSSRDRPAMASREELAVSSRIWRRLSFVDATAVSRAVVEGTRASAEEVGGGSAIVTLARGDVNGGEVLAAGDWKR